MSDHRPHNADDMAFDAENEASAAHARADAAAERRDMLVDKQTRLESELLVAVAIARETLSTLRRTDPQCAARCAKALLSSYNMYRNNRDYPNLSDLLDTVARCSLPAEGAPAGGRAAITGELVVPPTRAAGSRSRGANPQRLR